MIVSPMCSFVDSLRHRLSALGQTIEAISYTDCGRDRQNGQARTREPSVVQAKAVGPGR